MELDSLGSEMVRLFDGKRNVEQIARHLANTRKMKRREAEVALLRYLQVLVKRGIVGLAVPEKR